MPGCPNPCTSVTPGLYTPAPLARSTTFSGTIHTPSPAISRSDEMTTVRISDCWRKRDLGDLHMLLEAASRLDLYPCSTTDPSWSLAVRSARCGVRE